MSFVLKRDDGNYVSTNRGSGTHDWTNDPNQAKKFETLEEALREKDACERGGHKVDVINLDQPKKRNDPDWRTAGFLLLDRRFSEYRHVRGTTYPGGDYEVRCSVCGQVETFLGAGDPEVDALTFALHVARQHSHKE